MAGLPGDYNSAAGAPNYGIFNNPYATGTSSGVYAPWTSWHVDPNGRYPGFDVAKMGITGLAPLLFNQIGFANSLEPVRESMIRNFITQNQPGNQNYLIDAARRNALSQAQQGQEQMAASGYGGAYTDPGSAVQAGNQTGSDAYAQVHSTGYQNQLYSNVLGGIGQGQNLSGATNPLGQMIGWNVGTPRSETGLQTLGQMGGLLGNVLGGQMGGSNQASSGGTGAGSFSNYSGSGYGPLAPPTQGGFPNAMQSSNFYQPLANMSWGF